MTNKVLPAMRMDGPELSERDAKEDDAEKSDAGKYDAAAIDAGDAMDDPNMVQRSDNSESVSVTASQRRIAGLIAAAEVALIFVIFFAYAASPPPNVNESHYLPKAKSYWNPDWCPNDLFLDSGDAHLVFYWTFGWLTLFFSLPTVAWIGRIVVWLMTAFAWQRFSSAALPRKFFAPLTAGVSLVLLEHFHMAGEWLIGGVEAKGFAFAFVFLGLAQLIRGDFRWCWIWFGIASGFHVLVGGWSVIAAVVAWTIFGKERESIWRMLPFLGIGFACSLTGLIPAIVLTMGADEKTVDIANQIYTFGRLEHHLVFSAFEIPFVIRHGCLAAVWLILFMLTIKSRTVWRLNSFVLGAALIALAGIAIDQMILVNMGNNPSQETATAARSMAAKFLRFYWFRMSDVMIPIGVTISFFQLAFLFRGLKWKLWIPRMLAVPVVLLLAIIAIGWFLYHEAAKRQLDPRPRSCQRSYQIKNELDREFAVKRHEDWKEVCQWISEDTPVDAAFLTPQHQQTFKWYAHRSEVVSAKDIPQDAAKIVEWQKRFKLVHPGMMQYQWGTLYEEAFGIFIYPDEDIVKLCRQYDAQYVITDQRFAFNRTLNVGPISFEMVYPDHPSDNQFIVYRIIEPESEP